MHLVSQPEVTPYSFATPTIDATRSRSMNAIFNGQAHESVPLADGGAEQRKQQVLPA